MIKPRHVIAPALLLLGSIGLFAPASAQDGGFTVEERGHLLAGELVRRDLSRFEGGRMLYGGASWQRVEAPIEDVWQLATDASALTRLIPSLDGARVVQDRDGERLIEMHHSYGLGEARYHIVMRIDPSDHAMQFHLDPSRPHDIRSGNGHMRLSRYRGGTIVEWGMLIDPGGGVVMELFGPMLGEWLLLPPRCMRDEVEPGREPSC
jgi:carbon monoxide dehydrogenase subunit G